jgi:uncharacterized protein (DUF433 family)
MVAALAFLTGWIRPPESSIEAVSVQRSIAACLALADLTLRSADQGAKGAKAKIEVARVGGVRLLEMVGSIDNGYVIASEGSYRVAGSRVSLDSVVYDFLSGLSPESIVENYDTLTLEQVYGAIAYYLANRVGVDAHLERNRAKFDALRLQGRDAHPLLYRNLEEAEKVRS